jgi:hypothetical protein
MTLALTTNKAGPSGSRMSDDELEVTGLPPPLAYVYIML